MKEIKYNRIGEVLSRTAISVDSDVYISEPTKGGIKIKDGVLWKGIFYEVETEEDIKTLIYDSVNWTLFKKVEWK